MMYDGYLGLRGQALDDVENLRKATENRLRELTRHAEDPDGETRGYGLSILEPVVQSTVAMLRALYCDSTILEELEGKRTVRRARGCCVEHDQIRDLEAEFKKSPYAAWASNSGGLGKKQVARLVGAVGDPYWNTLYDRPRTVSELWAYCGYAVNAGEAQRLRKGVKANWSSDAKMRVYLIAVSCVKSKGKYRDVYDDARAQYTDATHPHDCVRCGPAGKPALAGSPLSAGHQHMRAIRRISKEILKDLWLEARAAHETD